ncbi:Cytochrome P450 [Dillenia turbinata]|uniref:Cytochrome P450 n=1 Tax=Dillenia turbinata TaxID=194707 RepID=A0AAN8ZRU6_9MAGN
MLDPKGTFLKWCRKQLVLVPEALQIALLWTSAKLFTLLGNETTSLTATWCLMLLASYPEWQERVRAEILEVYYILMTFSILLMMVIQETLRLYTPPIVLAREVLEDIKLGDLLVSIGTHIWALFPVLL